MAATVVWPICFVLTMSAELFNLKRKKGHGKGMRHHRQRQTQALMASSSTRLVFYISHLKNVCQFMEAIDRGGKGAYGKERLTKT